MSYACQLNQQLELAESYVEQTGQHVFLTGKAGTGKTTFLQKLQNTCSKRMITTAPTGVAALNAGGVTLHSFFQLPFGPFVPGSEAFEGDQQRQFRFSKEKKRIIQSLDLLVIDEISMVRADLLDAVDAALRRHRRSKEPFGGVQLLLIGDLHQLSPVAKQDEWKLLQDHYDSVYFFSSHALARTRFITIELEHIYRQSDHCFIQILNKVRDNELDQESVQKLNTRYCPDFEPGREQGYITLTSHNKKAQNINQGRLQELKGKEYCFSARISGDFPAHIYPTPAELLLKRGAQVMFLRNDPSQDKLFYNGKIGRISHISQDEIQVLCPDRQEPIQVEPLTWENIKYSLHPETKEIQEEVAGTFTQYPLKLAWAITIHKSQGLTFERAIIDVQNAFTPGQVYVALSRCKSLEGIVLSSTLASRGMGPDEAILRFDQQIRENPPSWDHLKQAKVYFQQQILLQCFDLSPLQGRLGYFVRLLQENSQLIQLTGIDDIHGLERNAENIFEVSQVFLRELKRLFSTDQMPAADDHLLERISKGSEWFKAKLEQDLGRALAAIRLETDNAELQKKISMAWGNLQKDLAIRLAGIQSCARGFSPEAYLQAVSRAEVESSPQKHKKPEHKDYNETDIAHAELFQALKKWRADKAKKQGLVPYQILHQRVAVQIAVNLPQTLAELKKLRGVGARTIANYGQELIEMVAAYRGKHGIEQVFLPQEPKSADNKQPSPGGQAGATQGITLKLFKQGLNVEQIAQARSLAQSTIERHLSYLVQQGDLQIHELLPQESQEAIEKAIAAAQDSSLREIKDMLGDGVSYGQIKMVLAHQDILLR